MQREDVRQGIYVRLLSDYLRIPAGTLDTIETVANIGRGDFYFTVRWLNPPPGTRSRPVSDRSLNLWLSDLEKFECVSRKEAEKILAARLPRQRKLPGWLRVRGNPTQLRLFDDF
jgi:hypothetical protein